MAGLAAAVAMRGLGTAEQHPSILEVLFLEQLQASAEPAFQFLVDRVLAPSLPRVAAAARFGPELFALLHLVVEFRSLRQSGASVAERIYGLRRDPRGAPLAGALLAAGLPYGLARLRSWYMDLSEREALGLALVEEDEMDAVERAEGFAESDDRAASSFQTPGTAAGAAERVRGAEGWESWDVRADAVGVVPPSLPSSTPSSSSSSSSSSASSSPSMSTSSSEQRPHRASTPTTPHVSPFSSVASSLGRGLRLVAELGRRILRVLRRHLARLVVRGFPVLHAVTGLARVACWLLFALGQSRAPTLELAILRAGLVRRGPEDDGADDGADDHHPIPGDRSTQATGQSVLSSPWMQRLASGIQILLGTALLGFQVLEWWFAAPDRAPSVTLPTGPIPPPPAPPTIDAAVSRAALPADCALCPLCRRPRKSPTASTSGVVFCFECLVTALQRQNRCPVTGLACTVAQVRRVYEQ